MGIEERYTQRTKRVLELAFREALSQGEHHVSPEHVLLGLMRELKGTLEEAKERAA